MGIFLRNCPEKEVIGSSGSFGACWLVLGECDLQEPGGVGFRLQGGVEDLPLAGH